MEKYERYINGTARARRNARCAPALVDDLTRAPRPRHFEPDWMKPAKVVEQRDREMALKAFVRYFSRVYLFGIYLGSTR